MEFVPNKQTLNNFIIILKDLEINGFRMQLR